MLVKPLSGGAITKWLTPEQLQEGRRLLWLAGLTLNFLVAKALLIRCSGHHYG
jgi:hypothetical protein